ncbi:hypothetical protein Kfla_6402 [Kribbella flavida DSM 17836]|uniref:DUF695 domain-containing protein n=1 Tax=Kribbella flavida (strain DSM 17836 / JCM 10339 / NBRC 14399) TaxID=479435 RepID=D2PX20_KRIFD|nr:DUF695 domain-containing protein [Kribbella flavida]ADB35400.1 hypothetical protein Kfla_6402 [Kribbella flavida DSM 17836]
MRIFKRRPVADPIEAFWGWWSAAGAEQVAAAVARKDPAATSGVLSEHVRAIDPGLDWELGPGLHAEHTLVVTAAGDPATRATARRWLRAAPPSDRLWEYADLRRPSPAVTIQFEGLPPVVSDEALVTIEPDERAAAVHVGVHHPAFARLPDEAQRRITFLLLDLSLGEEMTETWVGAVETLVDPPEGLVPITELLPAVAAFAAGFTTDTGDPTWRLLEGFVEGRRLIATTEVPLRSIRLPHLDTHVGVTISYPTGRDDGLPDADMLDQLRDLEDHLTRRLGDSGRLLAHETMAGARTLHYYVDGSTPAPAQLHAATTGWPHGHVSLTTSPDPGWQNLSHLGS